MDGASKFVRGDAIAGIIILAVNIFGGIVIGATRHGMSLENAADVYTKLSVGDGLVSQIPALIVSLAAALLVSKGGTRGSADQAVLSQLANYPRALFVAALLMGLLALIPGLPILPFALLGGVLAFTGYAIPRRRAERAAAEVAKTVAAENEAKAEAATSIKESLKTQEIELVLGKQLSGKLMAAHGELGLRVAKLRRKFAKQYGIVVPEIKVSDSLVLPPKAYQIKIHGTIVAQQEARLGEVLVIVGEGALPSVPGESLREPAFGMKAVSIPEAFAPDIAPRGLQGRRPDVGAADPPRRDGAQQSRAAPLLPRHARFARSPGAGVQAAHRGDLADARLLFGPAGDPEAAARRARLDPQPAPDPRGHRRDRPRTCAAPSRSSSTSACAWPSRSAATSPSRAS